jgi:hypothetical protein
MDLVVVSCFGLVFRLLNGMDGTGPVDRSIEGLIEGADDSID